MGRNSPAKAPVHQSAVRTVQGRLRREGGMLHGFSGSASRYHRTRTATAIGKPMDLRRHACILSPLRTPRLYLPSAVKPLGKLWRTSCIP